LGDRAFASSATLVQKRPFSKIDDILSIIYLMVFLNRGYNLPWPTSDNFVDRLVDIRVILKIREEKDIKEKLFGSLPAELKQIYEQALTHNRNYDPDYQSFRAAIFKLSKNL
jgi:hypothetical protein